MIQRKIDQLDEAGRRLAAANDEKVRKRKAGDNPWGVGATTLEWTLPSPPPFHTYNELPRIK